MTQGDGSFGSRWNALDWSKWIPLDASIEEYRTHIPTLPGFYRVRALDRTTLVYVGQTGRGLRERTRSLASNAYRDDPPWNDPHTAAPILWAYRREDEMQFEVSTAVAKLDHQTRQCQEDALLYLHRLEHNESTLCNHGRMHPWWTRPTNRKKSVPVKRHESPMAYPSLPAARGNTDVLSSAWLDLEWSEFVSLTNSRIKGPGVYRIKHESKILYFGESKNSDARMETHAKDMRFADCLVSHHYMKGALPHQLKERETDLIGAYFLGTGMPPVLQYAPVNCPSDFRGEQNDSDVGADTGAKPNETP